jgi:hypothetical protein
MPRPSACPHGSYSYDCYECAKDERAAADSKRVVALAAECKQLRAEIDRAHVALDRAPVLRYPTAAGSLSHPPPPLRPLADRCADLVALREAEQSRGYVAMSRLRAVADAARAYRAAEAACEADVLAMLADPVPADVAAACDRGEALDATRKATATALDAALAALDAGAGT